LKEGWILNVLHGETGSGGYSPLEDAPTFSLGVHIELFLATTKYGNAANEEISPIDQLKKGAQSEL